MCTLVTSPFLNFGTGNGKWKLPAVGFWKLSLSKRRLYKITGNRRDGTIRGHASIFFTISYYLLFTKHGKMIIENEFLSFLEVKVHFE